MNHLYWQSQKLSRQDREQLSGHKSFVIWFTGLSGSGKSTLSQILESKLHNRGLRTIVLDGDNIRHGISSNLGFSPEDRFENLRRVGEVAKLFLDAGVIVLAAFISPAQKDRSYVKELVGRDNFLEI
jgi:adenylylsulfate kinase